MKQRTAAVAIIAAVSGAISVLMAQWMFRGTSPSARGDGAAIEAIVNPEPGPTGAAADQSPPHEPQEPRLRFNACRDLHAFICSTRRGTDPTGAVRHDAEGEVETLRIYENLIRRNRRLPMESIEELLVKRIYTPARTRRVREIFETARERLVRFIDYQPFQSLSMEEKARLKARVTRAQLQLPPPASVYADEPDLFTRNDVFYERSGVDNIRIRVGGALLFTVQSRFNLAFTLAHELAHSIDPCELRSLGMETKFYTPVVGCLAAVESIESACNSSGVLAESFADWVATHIVAEILEEMAPKYTPTQVRSALYNSVRDLCQEDEELLTGPQVGLSASHPSNANRVNHIFAAHPGIRRLLGCAEAPMGPEAAGTPACFWLLGPRPQPEPEPLGR